MKILTMKLKYLHNNRLNSIKFNRAVKIDSLRMLR